MYPSSSEGYDVASFRGLVPVWEREENGRTGTKLIAVFQQHICTEVNALKGVVAALTGILESFLFMRTNAASSGLYGSRGCVDRSKKSVRLNIL